MTISEELIIAIANTYTLSELHEKLKEATEQFLSNPDRIVSAATGSGASYNKQANFLPKDLVELYSFALNYKQFGSFTQGADNQFGVFVINPFNH